MGPKDWNTCVFDELESAMDRERGTVAPETKASITPVLVDGRTANVMFITQSSVLMKLSSVLLEIIFFKKGENKLVIYKRIMFY